MSTYPRLEARVSALERRQINTDARIEEVTEDATTNFKQISSEITASFKHLSDYTGTIEDRFDKIEATMATKEDIARIEANINEIRSDIATINQNTLHLLAQILERLPDKSS